MSSAICVGHRRHTRGSAVVSQAKAQAITDMQGRQLEGFATDTVSISNEGGADGACVWWLMHVCVCIVCGPGAIGDCHLLPVLSHAWCAFSNVLVMCRFRGDVIVSSSSLRCHRQRYERESAVKWRGCCPCIEKFAGGLRS